ncbi:hypothetical protein [Pseudanabaena sp. FACHB-2040]|uniref:hypothetical protein n=1 Tax=Pseudanabaena sp. FACHB-2040 TaxID=2692859 RepID=UPI001684EA28|nr:hypothetical protein [Pseudanabaena sp. FACHB-2040]MBD2261406.1 hypothetical protein [Pseudanabaena sp. FACHB-2040]
MIEQLSLLSLTPEPESEPAPAPEIPLCHCCAVPGCDSLISEILLMCSRHWGQIPRELQAIYWAHYQAPDSPECIAATAAAVAAVSPPVLEPSRNQIRFLIGDRVCITEPIQGRSRPNPEDKKKPIPVWFTPWEGRVGTYCGLNRAGLALVDFGVGLYPVSLKSLSFAEMT